MTAPEATLEIVRGDAVALLCRDGEAAVHGTALFDGTMSR